MESYNFKAIEKKWQDKWEETGAFHAETNSKKPKFYTMIEFPYPSGAGLHVGHREVIRHLILSQESVVWRVTTYFIR